MPYKDKQTGRDYSIWWRANNPDKVEAQKPAINARRKWKYHNDPIYRRKVDDANRKRRWKVPPEEVEDFLKLYDAECFYCGGDGGSVDHLVPRCRGGEDRLYNLVPACLTCNQKKNGRTPEEWYGSEIQRSKRQKPSVGRA